jgi:two-component system, chemotaxis family, response regulator Rcp1
MREQGAPGKIRILVIEDNPADVDLLRRALKHAGLDCELTVIDDGADALALARNGIDPAQAPSLAIIDLNLPKHGGLEVLEQLRANPAIASLPVIILSSSSSPHERAAIERLHAARHIVKPPDLEEFLKIGWDVKELLEKRS